MARLEVLGHSVVYQNSLPNKVSEYVAFPAVQALPDGALLCMCRHGTARESDDGVVRIHRSLDGGLTWSPCVDLEEPTAVGTGMRLPGGFGLARDGDAVAWLSYPAAAGTSGQLLSRSSDGGVTWSAPEPAGASLSGESGPGGNLVTLADGTMVAAAEEGGEGTGDVLPTWRSMTTRSTDDGRTWSPWQTAHTHETTPGAYYFDLRLAGLPDGRLLAVYWTHDLAADAGLNVHTAISDDAGCTWSVPQDAGFWGQVTDVCALHSGRVLAVTNHRRAPLGVRAVLSEDGGRSFDETRHVELWGIEPARVRSAEVLARKRDLVTNALASYHHFTFGTPSTTQLPDGTIIVVFYVTEEHVTYVRCCRLREVES